MPTNIRQKTYTGVDEDINILATNHFKAPISRTVDTSFLQFDENGDILVKPGSIWAAIPNSKLVRPYPLTTVASALAASDTTITVADAKLFRLGGALVVMRPSSRLTIAGTPANTNTITVVVEGQSVVTTLDATTGATTTTAAAAVAAVINASSLRDKVQAIAAAAIVHIFSKTQAPYTLTTSVTGGGATSTALNAVMQENVVIGSIHAVTPINAVTNVITLAAGSAIALPVGAPIGIATLPSQILGISVTRQLVASNQKFLEPITNDIAAYTEADIYTSLIPYWDAWVSQALPQIRSIPRG